MKEIFCLIIFIQTLQSNDESTSIAFTSSRNIYASSIPNPFSFVSIRWMLQSTELDVQGLLLLLLLIFSTNLTSSQKTSFQFLVVPLWICIYNLFHLNWISKIYYFSKHWAFSSFFATATWWYKFHCSSRHLFANELFPSFLKVRLFKLMLMNERFSNKLIIEFLILLLMLFLFKNLIHHWHSVWRRIYVNSNSHLNLSILAVELILSILYSLLHKIELVTLRTDSIKIGKT